MKTPKTSKSHFFDHWLPWLALYHFLPAADLREVACGMVSSVSRGKLTLNELFDEHLIDSGAASEAWIITPKTVTTPLARYLQSRIRSLVWGNDDEVFFDPKTEWDSLAVHPSLIEAAINLGSHPSLDQCERINTAHNLTDHPELTALLHCIEAGSRDASHGDTSTYLKTIENAVAELGMPLRAAVLKFTGDNAALDDRWVEAATIYEGALSLLSEDKHPASSSVLSGLTTATVQSLATASRVLEGKEKAAAIFDNAQKRWPAVDPILFPINASHESHVAHTGDQGFPHDQRTTSLRTPLVIETHNIETPILKFLESNYPRANQLFHARLRRQIALGSTVEARLTKAAYARTIIASLTTKLEAKRDSGAFMIATHLLIQSGAQELVSNIVWDKGLVEAYVNVEIIRSMQELATAFDGVRAERQLVAIELLSSWAMQLSSDRHDVGTPILRLLAQYVKDNEATSYTNTNICGSSLKALKEIGISQPDWLRSASTFVAEAIAARLHTPGWWTGTQLAAETALTYANAFSNAELASVVEAAVQALEQTESSLWVVIRPLQDFITSARASAFIRADQNLERKVIKLLIQHGTAEQGNEQANLVHYLRAFDARLLDDPNLKIQLQDAVEDIKQKAKMLNSSASQANIQALLGAPTVSGLQGVLVALESLREILQSAESTHHNISLPTAYYPLLQIAVEHDRIAAGIGVSNEEFLNMLAPLGDFLEELWTHTASDLSIFVPFAIPPNQVPNPVAVHNWTFVSLEFARLLGKETTIECLIDSAAQSQPSIAKAIARAKAIQALSSGDEDFDETKIKTEGKEIFYLYLGSRLSQVDGSSDEGREQCRLLMQMCLKHGPNDLDMAAFILARQCRLSLTENGSFAVSAYMARLGTDPDKQLSFLPLLKQLGYKQELENANR